MTSVPIVAAIVRVMTMSVAMAMHRPSLCRRYKERQGQGSAERCE